MKSKIIDFTIVIQTCHLLQSILICDWEKFRLFWDILSYVVVWHCMRLIPCLLDCALLQCMSMPISSLSPCSTVAQSNPAECGTQTRQCRAWSQQNCRHWLYSKQPSNKQQPDTSVEGNICCSPQHHIIHLRFRAVFLSNLKTWAIWMSHMTPFTCSMQVAKNNKEVLAFSGPIKKAAETCWSGVGMCGKAWPWQLLTPATLMNMWPLVM